MQLLNQRCKVFLHILLECFKIVEVLLEISPQGQSVV